MVSPCYECPHRKVMCHDRCEEYMEFHDGLVAAKKSLRAASEAVDYLIRMSKQREKKARVKK